MSYVIVRNETGAIVRNNRTGKEFYASMGRATHALERMVANGQLKENQEEEHGLIHSWYTCYELEYYRNKVEKYETVINLMSGKEVRQSVNTPLCCDVSSETYWSM